MLFEGRQQAWRRRTTRSTPHGRCVRRASKSVHALTTMRCAHHRPPYSCPHRHRTGADAGDGAGGGVAAGLVRDPPPQLPGRPQAPEAPPQQRPHGTYTGAFQSGRDPRPLNSVLTYTPPNQTPRTQLFFWVHPRSRLASWLRRPWNPQTFDECVPFPHPFLPSTPITRPHTIDWPLHSHL